MQNDLKESLMIIAGRNLAEYEILRNLSVSDFLVKYKLFIEDLNTKE